VSSRSFKAQTERHLALLDWAAKNAHYKKRSDCYASWKSAELEAQKRREQFLEAANDKK
jgi:hypothetical protein